MTASTRPTAGVGIVGAGNIARRYVEGIARFAELRVVGCTDVIPSLAESLAQDYGFSAFATLDQLLRSPEVDIVVNITPPSAHAEVTTLALEAGKAVYVEKPISVTSAQAFEVLRASKMLGRTVGAAPDTFLGSAGQTARHAFDSGLIGAAVAASAFVTHNRAETWHPDPTFLFQEGGGPALDLGPYYLTSLVNLLGPVETVSGLTRLGPRIREVTAPNRRVEQITVATPTHWTAVLRFVSGAIGTIMFSFDVWDANLPKIEIYGEEGTLSLPDPNEFDGDVLLKRHGDPDWSVLTPVIAPGGAPGTHVQLLRGAGVADLAGALRGGTHRATGNLAAHVLEVLEAIRISSESETVVRIHSRLERPAPIEQALETTPRETNQ